MNGRKIKSRLIRLIGEKPTACLQAVRFAYLIKVRAAPDPEAGLLGRWLHRGDVAVDVGAYGADWTHDLHRHVGPRGRVYAFEADHYNALATHVAIRLLRLRGVTLFPFGLSDKSEHVHLRVTDSSGERLSGLTYVEHDAMGKQTEHEAIDLHTLDSLTATHPRLLDACVLKCDVEGYELPVLRGAAALIDRARPVIIFEVGHFERHGYCGRDVSRFLSRSAYRCVTVLRGGRLDVVGDDLHHPAAISVNRVAIPEEKLHTVRDLVL
ncbi:MAG: FkbM family methyltransferase [Planctomycetes bacterium]|nr:FkbM family methyltransferase [Planctomycetota bacterium]